MDSESVHSARQFRRKRLIDHPVPLDAGLPFEGIRHNINAIVSLSAGPMPGMAFVLM